MTETPPLPENQQARPTAAVGSVAGQEAAPKMPPMTLTTVNTTGMMLILDFINASPGSTVLQEDLVLQAEKGFVVQPLKGEAKHYIIPRKLVAELINRMEDYQNKQRVFVDDSPKGMTCTFQPDGKELLAKWKKEQKVSNISPFTGAGLTV